MIPVDQTRTGEDGNCFAACIASLFEIPIEDAYDPIDDFKAKRNWVIGLNKWLSPYGMAYIQVDACDLNWRLPEGYYFAGGGSPRGIKAGHQCIGCSGRIVHDPHPSRDGLTSVEDYGFFVKVWPVSKESQ